MGCSLDRESSLAIVEWALNVKSPAPPLAATVDRRRPATAVYPPPPFAQSPLQPLPRAPSSFMADPSPVMESGGGAPARYPASSGPQDHRHKCQRWQSKRC
jgi:hypothetical protein